MTQPEYDQQKRECWEEYLSEHKTTYTRTAFDYAFDRAYSLGKQEKEAEENRTIKVNCQLFCRLCADADDYINDHLEEDDSDYAYYQGRSDALHELYRGECEKGDNHA